MVAGLDVLENSSRSEVTLEKECCSLYPRLNGIWMEWELGNSRWQYRGEACRRELTVTALVCIPVGWSR